MVEIFQLQLHKSSAVPLYQQLAEGIEGMITDGVLLANSKLPAHPQNGGAFRSEFCYDCQCV